MTEKLMAHRWAEWLDCVDLITPNVREDAVGVPRVLGDQLAHHLYGVRYALLVRVVKCEAYAEDYAALEALAYIEFQRALDVVAPGMEQVGGDPLDRLTVQFERPATGPFRRGPHSQPLRLAPAICTGEQRRSCRRGCKSTEPNPAGVPWAIVLVAISPNVPPGRREVERPAEEVGDEVSIAVRLNVDRPQPVRVPSPVPSALEVLPTNGGLPTIASNPGSLRPNTSGNSISQWNGSIGFSPTCSGSRLVGWQAAATCCRFQVLRELALQLLVAFRVLSLSAEKMPQ